VRIFGSSRQGQEGTEPQPETSAITIVRGVIIIALVATAARLISTWMTLLPDVAFALAFGLAIRNLVLSQALPAAGFTVHYVLRLAIILLGSSLGLVEAMARGGQTLGLIVGLVIVAILLGLGLARVFRLGNAIGTLIGVGTAICGASAILVVSPLVKAKSEETAYALTTIFAFNLVALLVYPWVGHRLHMSQVGFGIWDGTAVNDTSVVVATGYVFGTTAGAVATVIKLTRTVLLLPLVVIIGMMQSGPRNKDWGARLSRAVPWFVLGFLAMSAARSLGAIPALWLAPLTQIASFLIVCVLAAVGLNTDLRSMVRLGPRPLIVGFLLAGTMGVLSITAIQGLHLG
jgi:uncharacterized integral membrane protein (TIGR00698 family)